MKSFKELRSQFVKVTSYGALLVVSVTGVAAIAEDPVLPAPVSFAQWLAQPGPTLPRVENIPAVGWDALQIWCDRTPYFLRQTLGQANLFYAQGDIGRAIQTLVQGLRDLAVSPAMVSGYRTPHSRILLERTLRIAALIVPVVVPGTEGPSRFYLASVYRVLERFTQVVIKLATDYDRPLWGAMPYPGNGSGYGPVPGYGPGTGYGPAPGYGPSVPAFADPESFDAQIVQISGYQLTFIAEQFADVHPREGVIPVGSPELFLAVVKMVGSEVAVDLRNTLTAPSNACVILELEEMLNSMDRDPNIRFAINRVYHQLRSIAPRLVAHSYYGGCARR